MGSAMLRLACFALLAAATLTAQIPANVKSELDVAYDTRSGKQKLDLFYQEAAGNGLRPGMVIVHGGGWRGGDKGGGQWRQLPVEFAKRGYVAISVNYRLTDEAPSPARIHDVKAAVRWLRANAARLHLDKDRIGAYGNSAGAHLVAILGLAKPSDGMEGDGPNRDQSSVVQAVLASATPTDFLPWLESKQYPGSALDPFFAGPEETRAKRVREASPVTYARADAPPFLLVHGTADRTVPIAQPQRLVNALRKAGAKEVRYMMFDNEGHGVFQSQRLLTYPAMFAFFDAALR
jgi:acetyl esterase/lipase